MTGFVDPQLHLYRQRRNAARRRIDNSAAIGWAPDKADTRLDERYSRLLAARRAELIQGAR